MSNICFQNYLKEAEKLGLDHTPEELADIEKKLSTITNGESGYLSHELKAKLKEEIFDPIEARTTRKALIDTMTMGKVINAVDKLELHRPKQNIGKTWLEWLDGTGTGGGRTIQNEATSFRNRFTAMLHILSKEEMALIKTQDIRVNSKIFEVLDAIQSKQPISSALSGSIYESLGRKFGQITDGMLAIKQNYDPSIHRIQDYFIRRVYNKSKILAETKENFVKFMDERYDIANNPDISPKEKLQILADTYDKATGNRYVGREKLYNALDSGEGERVLKAKNFQSEADFHEKYGEGTIFNALESMMNAEAKHLAISSKFGGNPKKFLKHMDEYFGETVKNMPQKEFDAFMKYKKTADKALDIAVGSVLDTGADNIASKALSALTTARYIHNAGTFSLRALSDIATLASVKTDMFGKSFIGNFTRGIIDVGSNIFKSAEGRQKISARLGLPSRVLVQELNYHIAEMSDGLLKKSANFTSKITFFRRIDDSIRIAMGTEVSQSLAAFAETGWKKMSDLDIKVFLSRGLNENDFNVLQHLVVREIDGETLSNPIIDLALIHDIPSEIIENYAEANYIAGKSVNLVKEDITQKLSSFINYMANKATNTPQDRELRIMGYFPGASKGKRNAFNKAFFQFRSATLTQLTNVGDLFNSQRDGSVIRNLTQLMLASMGMGAATNQLLELGRGKTTVDPYSKQFILQTLVSSGVAGVYGDFIQAGVQNLGKEKLTHTVADVALGSVFGPAAKIVESGVSYLTTDNPQTKWAAARTAATQAWQYVPTGLPMNMPFTTALLDTYLKMAVGTYLDPTYRAKTRVNMKLNTKQEFWSPID